MANVYGEEMKENIAQKTSTSQGKRGEYYVYVCKNHFSN